MTQSVFASYAAQNYPYVYEGTIHMTSPIAGGVPTTDNKAEAWIRSKISDSDDNIRAEAAKVVVERGVTMDDAINEIVKASHLNGFRRDQRGLYIGGYQLKAALKEAANVAANEGRLTSKGWGNPDNANYKKGLKAWFPEHVFVIENRIHLLVDGSPTDEPTGIAQRFVHTRNGSGIQYEEYVEDCDLRFTVETDHEFEEKEWAAIWLAGERLGVGATRSQGYGTYEVTRWEQVK